MEDRELDSLPPKTRAAVVAACAEHVLDFYRLGNFSLRVRQAPGATLSAPPDSDLLEHALQLAWSYAEGKPPSDATLDAVLAGLRADPDDASADDMCMPGLTTLGMVGDVVRSLRDETPYHARKALKGGRNAIIDGLGGAVVRDDEAQAFAEQEHRWQREVLERAQSKGNTPLTRAAFADLIGRELPWRAHLPAYRAYNH
jgi:hypothetical protein